MRRLAPTRVWTRLTFSVKFALIIAVAGSVIAAIPLMMASGENRLQAAQRASDKAGIVANLISGQERSLTTFAAGMGVELTPSLTARDIALVRATLTRYSQVNAVTDVVAAQGALAQLAVRGGRALPATDPLYVALAAQAGTGAHIVPDAGGAPWLIGTANVGGSDERMFIARPLDAAFIDVLASTISTEADSASVAIVRDGRVAAPGSRILGAPAPAGTAIGEPLGHSGDVPGSGATVAVAGQDAGADNQALDNGYSAVVTTPLNGTGALWQPVALLLALIAGAMVIIAAVVHLELQRPLRRLDRAVAAMSGNEYDVPVPPTGSGEIGRLATTFEAMRNELRLTVVGARARARIAGDLNSPQPLETALRHVCAQLRETTGADAALILVSGNEMADSFAVAEGMHDDLDVPGLLGGDGPLGTAYRHSGPEPLVVSAAPASLEHRAGLRCMLTAPLRMGPTVLGVLAIHCRSGEFSAADASLVASSAEQVTLALERYRFIAMVQRQASTDDLTGLHNHRFLVDYLGQQVALAERMGTPLAVLILDLDHFKRVNDTYGHPVGDAVLQTFAQTLVGSIRRSDLAARYGGEEFVVVMANTHAHDARMVGEKIRTAVAQMRVAIDADTAVSCTVSIGGAAYPEDTTTARELLATADASLYDAKRAGRNRVSMAGSDGDESEVPHNVALFPRRSAQ